MAVSTMFWQRGEPTQRRLGRNPRSRSAGRLAEATSASHGTRSCEDIGDDADLEFRTLNESLEMLVAVFPDVQIEVFREMLSTFDKESRLYVITETLLKQKSKWVQGRLRVREKEAERTESRSNGSPEEHCSQLLVPLEERFRSRSYKAAVNDVLCQEFRGLSRSSINAVLAEQNYSYTHARPTLLALSAKSWRFALSSFIFRRKTLAPAPGPSHPLLVFPTSQFDKPLPSLPELIPTASEELNDELRQTLLEPLRQQRQEAQERLDLELANLLNEKEAETYSALHDCDCCISSTTFEQLASCNTSGHLLCFQCIRHSTNEALYGQGWGRSIDHSSGSLRCLAPEDCNGHIPTSQVQRALEAEKGGADIYRQFEDRVSSEALTKSLTPLVRCPFCVYAEVDELHTTPSPNWSFKSVASVPLSTTLVLVVALAVLILLSPLRLLFPRPQAIFQASLQRLARLHRAPKFSCRNPRCGRASCLHCHKLWLDPHICYESERLRHTTYLSNALSAALKRTCPRCSLSFVKASGCNKLTCVCGYVLCYVCRRELGPTDGYKHFCEHFRPVGGRCRQCDKCDLYREEDEKIVLERARREAESRWLEKEGDVGIASEETWGKTNAQGWEGWVDGVLDRVILIKS
ncbi:MAG: hypothetical protein M1824_003539 [Vezdaea acicularis]|nr:MAG: hypothetical protein M1824_003539 [Vezdaea acicularis]